MSKKSLFGKLKRRSGNEEVSLQITSMADIFTILLVFLLKSSSTGAVSINPSQGLLLPQANASQPVPEALKIEVSQGAIQIEEKPVASLKDFQFETGDIRKDGVSSNLEKHLELARKRQSIIAKANSDVQVDAKILVIADSRTPYKTLKTVLASAAIHGYTDFKLVVAKDQ